jgi:hypothetical protein
VFSLHRFELDGHFFTSCHVCPQVDVPERTAPNLAAQSVLLANPQLHPSALMLLVLQCFDEVAVWSPSMSFGAVLIHAPCESNETGRGWPVSFRQMMDGRFIVICLASCFCFRKAASSRFLARDLAVL